MLTNVAVLYSGSEAEQAALEFGAAVAAGLGCSVACRYACEVLGVLDADQRADYRALIEIEGFDAAQRFLGASYAARLAGCAAAAATSFHALPAAARLVWGTPLALADDPGAALASVGYLHDMVVASFEISAPVRDMAIERVLVGAGAPLALVAHPPRAARLEEMAMVYAWKPSASAKHALRYALPLLRRARQVYLVAIEEEGEALAVPSVQEIADYLMNVHSVATSPMLVTAADNPALQLENLYRDVGADLLVLGAYSHSRLRQLVFGGFTRHFLLRRGCNLLLAH